MVFEPFVLRIGGPLCINCCWFHFILYTAGATLYLMLWEPLCMYFANSQKGRRVEWAGWCGLSAWEKSERNVRKPNSGKIQTQRNKYFCDVRSKCQKSKWKITGGVKAEGQIFLPKAQNWMFWWNLFLFCNSYISNIHIQEHISVMI